MECSSSAGGQRTSLKGPVHVLPTSSRTSAEKPPKTTETPRSGSHTIAWLSRAVGPFGSWLQDDPFQAQVSM